MASKKSAEELPSGWTVQFNVLKTGRKIKYYVSSGTGQKFFSKDEVMRYIKIQSTQFDQPQPTKRPIRRHSENNQMHLVKSKNERPEWLPHGWIMELKTRNNGLRSGTIYKCYIDMSTGFKFYSKPEVFRYLKTVKHKSCPYKKEMPVHVHITSKVTIEKSIAEDLPPGWVKEVKIRQNANGIRRDPYYRDPVNGYVFRSMRAVHRYLETGGVGRDAFLSKKRHINDKTTRSPAAKRQKIKHPATSQLLVRGNQSSGVGYAASSEIEASGKRRGERVSTEATLSVAHRARIPLENCLKDGVFDNDTESEENSNTSMSALPSSKVSKRNQGKKVGADNGSVLTPEADIPKRNSLESRVKKGNRNKSSNKKRLNLPLRSSKRLAGLEPELLASSVPTAQVETMLPVAPISLIPIKKCPKDHVIDNGAESKDTCNTSCLALLNAEVSKRDLGKKFCASNGSLLTPEIDIMQEQNSLESGAKRSRRTQNSLSKSNNKKGLDLPCRSSKRLAGLEPELVANSVSSVPALQNATKSCKSEAILAVGLTSCGFPCDASQQLEAESKTALPHHATDPDNSFHGGPSNKSQKPLHGQAVPKEQLQELEIDETDDDKSEPQLIPPTGEFWSDPCLEFAFKTLTGAIPVENAADNGLLSTPAADIVKENNMLIDKIDKSSNKNTLINSSKSKTLKQHNFPYLSCKQHSELQLESMAGSKSDERASQIVARKSNKSEAVLDVGRAPFSLVDRVSPCLKGGEEAVRAHYGSADGADVKATLHKKPSNRGKEPLNDHILMEEKSQKLESGKMNSDKPEPQPSFSFGDYWSDPCLEFAFKTLTGAIPLEDYLPIQGYFQQQVDASQIREVGYRQQNVDTSQNLRDGSLALPDFGLPSHFQADISAHFDDPEKQPASHPHFPLNSPSFLPSGNVSLPGCSSIGSQQPHLEGNKGLSGKVNS